MLSLILVVLSSILLPMANAQAQPDGLLVPFTSGLPACASLCGKLFDVQGACVPPVAAEASKSCFCADPRLKSLATGTAGVSSVCGATSCQDQASLQKIQTWYETFCNIAISNPTTASGAPGASGTGANSSTPRPTVYPTWFEGHWKWVVALIVMVIVIAGAWVGAIFLRRRYLRKKEKEFEMRPAVAWGPHQMQGATGGHGAVDPSVGGHSKESVVLPPAATKSKGWLRKQRS